MENYKGISFIDYKELDTMISEGKITGPLERKNICKYHIPFLSVQERCDKEAANFAKEAGYDTVYISGSSQLIGKGDLVRSYEFYKKKHN